MQILQNLRNKFKKEKSDERSLSMFFCNKACTDKAFTTRHELVKSSFHIDVANNFKHHLCSTIQVVMEMENNREITAKLIPDLQPLAVFNTRIQILEAGLMNRSSV